MATVSGVWVFHDTLDIVSLTNSLGTGAYIPVNFTITRSADDAPWPYIGFYLTPEYFAYRNAPPNSGHNWSYNISTNSWWASYGQTVDFGTAEQTVSDTFYAWFTANATQQASEEEAGGATVAYNGSDLLSLEAGQTGTLNCAGTKMAGDVVVSFEGVGSVAYNGSVIASLSAGQSATLYCAGKKMAGNVVITCDGGSSN